jgi:hypothetical protein
MTKTRTAARDWREQVGAGARYVGHTEAGLFWVETANSSAGQVLAQCAGAIEGARSIDEIRDQLLGRIAKECYAAAANAGWPVDPGALETIVAGVPGWYVRADELVFDPDGGADVTAPVASGEIQLLARNRVSALWSCVTSRPLADVLSPRFVASHADSLERFDRVLVTCEADSARPVHAELVVDSINRSRREVTTKLLAQAVTERAMPRVPANG